MSGSFIEVISKVFNKLVLSFIFHVSGTGISDSVMPTWKKKNCFHGLLTVFV